MSGEPWQDQTESAGHLYAANGFERCRGQRLGGSSHGGVLRQALLRCQQFRATGKRYAAASNPDAIHTAMFTWAPRRRVCANRGDDPTGRTCESRIHADEPLVDASINSTGVNVMRQLNRLHRSHCRGDADREKKTFNGLRSNYRSDAGGPDDSWAIRPWVVAVTRPERERRQRETVWLDDDQQRAWRQLLSMIMELPAALESDLQRTTGLTTFEYLVLAILSEADDRTLRMSELASSANSSLSRLSHVVRRLAGNGLVVKRVVPMTAG